MIPAPTGLGSSTASNTVTAWPARARKSADAAPAERWACDSRAYRGESMREAPVAERRQRLLSLAEELDEPWHLAPQTTSEDVAKVWFDEYEPAGCDGIIAKRPELAYQHGKRAMIKIKHRRTIDVVVGGFREHKDGGKIGSLLLGLYNDRGDFHFIGHCSGFPNADRVEIYNRFMELRSEESFDEAARAPGGPSRWSTGKDTSWTPVQPGVVVEVSYDQLEGDRFRHATRFHRWRPDKDAAACTMDQLERPQGPGFRDVVD